MKNQFCNFIHKGSYLVIQIRRWDNQTENINVTDGASVNEIEDWIRDEAHLRCIVDRL